MVRKGLTGQVWAKNKGNTPTTSLAKKELTFSEKSLSQNFQGEVPEDGPSGEKM